MPFPVVVGTSTSQENDNVMSHTVNLPGGIESGDLLILLFSGSRLSFTTWPAGYTEFPGYEETTGSMTFSAAYRKADGGEGASIEVTVGISLRSAHIVYRITGHKDPDIQAPEISVATTGDSSAPDPGSLTPTGGAVDQFLWLAAGGSYTGTRVYTAAPTDYTNLLTSAAPNSLGCTIGSARRERNASVEDPGAFTVTSVGDWIAAVIAVHPALSTFEESFGLDHEADINTAAQTIFEAAVSLGTRAGLTPATQADLVAALTHAVTAAILTTGPTLYERSLGFSTKMGITAEVESLYQSVVGSATGPYTDRIKNS